MNLAALLARQAGRRPEAVALVEAGRRTERRVTFAQLDARVDAVALDLQARGLAPGDLVLLAERMSIALYAAVLGAWRAGMTVLLPDAGGGRPLLRHSLALRPPRGLIAAPRVHLLRLVEPALRAIPVKWSTGIPLPGAPALGTRRGRAPSPDVPPDHPALLTFTSGSTGEPRGIVRTHGLLAVQQAALEEHLDLRPGQVDLGTLPVFALANLAAGVTTVIPGVRLEQPGTLDADALVGIIRRVGPTRLGAAPELLRRVAAVCARERRPIGGITRVTTGGGPVSPGLLRRLAATFPGAAIHALYGSTEAEPVASFERGECTDDDAAAARAGRGLLAGAPTPPARVRILPDRWGEPLGPLVSGAVDRMALPAGEPGEIAVAGPHVVPGSLDGRGDATTKLREGETVWHRTGDAGYLDARGRLWLLGRCAAVLRDGRGTLHPFAVEAAVADDPEVARTALVGLDGRRVLAVEPAAGAGSDLPGRLGGTLAWARLDEIRLLRRIPVDARHHSKIDYPALRRLFSNG